MLTMANSPSSMTSLISCLADARKAGYTQNLTVTENGLSAVGGNQFYNPTEVKVDNFYRFEGASDPSESAILYLISTADGNKGTLTDAYGPYADVRITDFMDKVMSIEKKTN